MKKLFVLTGVVFFACLVFVSALARPLNLDHGISRIADKIDQAQQELEDAAGHVRQQQQSGRSSAAQHKQLRSKARALHEQLDSLAGVMKDVERTLERSGRHDLLNKHRERTAELEQRLDHIRDSLAPDERERLSETGLPFGRVSTQREREERIYGRDGDSIENAQTAPGTLLGPAVEPLRRAPQEVIDPDGGEALIPSGKAYALAQDQGVFRLVSFERDNTFENTAPGPEGVHPALRFDLDLPLGARPVLVAGLGELHGLLSQAALQAVSLPVPGDFEADGKSVVITPEIAALAEELGANPVRIYEYVKNTIMYQPYWGALKSAAETLAQQSGNDADQAGLLIALLRASGYAARYGRSLVTVDIDRAKQWLGVEHDTAVDWMLATAGVPGTTALIDKTGKIRAVRFEHIFVEAYLPYADYRGSGESERHKLWVPLAPAFKKRLDVAGMDITELVDFDVEALVDYLEAHAQKNPDGSYTGFDTAWLQEQIADYVRRVRDYLVSEGISLRDLTGYEEIIPQKMEILPITLPFASQNTIVFSALPDNLHYLVRVRLADSGGIELAEAEGRLLIDWQTSFVELNAHRFTLSWQADTEEDITQLPAYLVTMTPQLRLAGEVAAQGPERMLGSEAIVRVQIVSPNAQYPLAHAYDYRIAAGDYTAIVSGTDAVTGAHLLGSAERLQEAVDARAEDRDRVVGEYLYLTGLLYHFRLGLSEKQTARQHRVHHFRKPSALICNAHLEMKRVAGDFPISIKGYRLIFDFGNNYSMVIPKTADLQSRLRCIQAIGPEMSALEHVVLQEMFLSPAVSAVKLLELANAEGMAIYDITPENRSELLGRLDLPAEDLALISRELDRGQRVTVTKTRLSAGTYTGAPIISLPFDESDPYAPVRTGYFISGPANGGELYDMVKDWLTAKGLGGWFDYTANTKNVIQDIVTNSDEIAPFVRSIGAVIYNACTTAWKKHFPRGYVFVDSLTQGVFWRYVGLGSLIIYIDFRAGDNSEERMEQGEHVKKDNVYLKGDRKEAFYKIISMYGGEPFGVELWPPQVRKISPQYADCDFQGSSELYPDDRFYFSDSSVKHRDKLEIELKLPYRSHICLREFNTSTTRGTYDVCGITELYLEGDETKKLELINTGSEATVKIDDADHADDIEWEYEITELASAYPAVVSVEPEGARCKVSADQHSGPAKVCLKAYSTLEGFEQCRTERCFYVVPIRLREITFGGDRYIPILRDDGSARYDGEHWLDENLDGIIDESDGERKYPVMYVSSSDGTESRLLIKEAEFEFIGSPETDLSQLSFKIRGTGPGDIQIPEQSAVVFENKLTISDAESSGAFKGEVDFFDPMTIQWQCRIENVTDWFDVGTSENQLYVTFQAPRHDFLSGIFHTVVHLGCKNAKGLSNTDLIRDAIWNEFTDREVKRVDGRLLTYYAQYTTQNDLLDRMLKDPKGDGNCYAWATFFIEMLQALIHHQKKEKLVGPCKQG
jgi:F0F1-type ATP synthase membrane subunit b/b'